MKSNKEWINISDMMSGLMMVFLFIAVFFMVEVQSEQKKIKNIAMAYKMSQQALNIDLNNEFKDDLSNWGAQITKDNIVRFNSPDVLFKSGSMEISNTFRDILNDFFPRYIALLTSSKHKDKIDEVRIEGHTSYGWEGAQSKDDMYLKNMRLSQNRANNVLGFCYKMRHEVVHDNIKWLEQKLRANGMAFAKLIYKENGQKDDEKSRRVEFRALTKAQENIYKIIEQF